MGAGVTTGSFACGKLTRREAIERWSKYIPIRYTVTLAQSSVHAMCSGHKFYRVVTLFLR